MANIECIVYPITLYYFDYGYLLSIPAGTLIIHYQKCTKMLTSTWILLSACTQKKSKNADKNRKKNQSSLAATTRDNKVRLTLGFED